MVGWALPVDTTVGDKRPAREYCGPVTAHDATCRIPRLSALLLRALCMLCALAAHEDITRISDNLCSQSTTNLFNLRRR